jgi:hypothetical protein
MSTFDWSNLTREELEAAFIKVQQEKQQLEQQVKAKRTNKTDKLLNELKDIFNNYSNNSTDNLQWLHFLLSTIYNKVELPIHSLLGELSEEPEIEDLEKLIKMQTKELVKTDDFKLRKSKKNTETINTEVVEQKEVNTPL